MKCANCKVEVDSLRAGRCEWCWETYIRKGEPVPSGDLDAMFEEMRNDPTFRRESVMLELGERLATLELECKKLRKELSRERKSP